MLAHELRNPLASVGNAVQLLAFRGRRGRHPAWSHDVIARQVKHLARLIDDLLDVSRITRGKIQLRKETARRSRVCSNAPSRRSAPSLEEREPPVHRLDRPPSPCRLDADPTRLEQIIVNLLNNAAKYTDAGGQIRLTAGRDGDRGRHPGARQRGRASPPRSSPRSSTCSPRATARSPARRAVWASA